RGEQSADTEAKRAQKHRSEQISRPTAPPTDVHRSPICLLGDSAMTDMHPNDMPAPLDWTLNHARESAASNELMRLMHMPAPQQLRNEAQREARGG
ncbi:hypothetical protein, partial [Xanthomonas vasicola]